MMALSATPTASRCLATQRPVVARSPVFPFRRSHACGPVRASSNGSDAAASVVSELLVVTQQLQALVSQQDKLIERQSRLVGMLAGSSAQVIEAAAAQAPQAEEASPVLVEETAFVEALPGSQVWAWDEASKRTDEEAAKRSEWIAAELKKEKAASK